MRFMLTPKTFFIISLLWAGFFIKGPNVYAQTYTLDVQAENFYAAQVERIDSIRVMESTDKVRLRDYFVSYLLNNADLKWSFQLAMSRVTTYPLYYIVLFKDDILPQANRKTLEEIRKLRVLCHENDSCILKFIPTIRCKNEDLAILEKIYVTDDSILTLKKHQVVTRYEMKRKNFILSHLHFSKNYDLALKCWKSLELSNSQIDSIIIYGKEVKSYLTRNPDYDYWKHERTHLRSLLTETQYDRFLTQKHQFSAYRSAQSNWRILKEHDLVADMDSVRVIREATNFHLERSKLYDLYAYDDREKYMILSAELYRNFCPAAVRRANEITNNKSTSKNYQGSYTW